MKWNRKDAVVRMDIRLTKQARKYLTKVDDATRKKLYKALDQIATLEGDIARLQGYECRYRYKLEHFRIVFEWCKGEIVIKVIEINTRTNVKY